jgi:hypothetical protein
MEPLDTDCDAPNWYFRKVLMVACDAPRLCMRQASSRLTVRTLSFFSFTTFLSCPSSCFTEF